MAFFLKWAPRVLGFALAVAVVVIAVALTLFELSPDSKGPKEQDRFELEAKGVPVWQVESVLQDKIGDTAVMCIPQLGWVSKSDAVRAIRDDKAVYVVSVPGQEPPDSTVHVEEWRFPYLPTTLTTSPGNPDANLLATLPTCNMANFLPAP